MLQIKRNTGLSGAGSKMTIYINDEKAGKIKQNQQMELALPANEAKLGVKQLVSTATN